DEIEQFIEERNQARLDKNWQRADEIRHALLDQGIELEDTKLGTIWRRVAG
ncbi:MAG: cysteine--tRNA ligase, partial [Legionellales bacterium]|nr:cysteine--tRNA ligase [Legionellales bacterium]